MIPLHPNDHELLRRLREHWRTGVVLNSPTQLAVVDELMHEDAERNDPDWKRPEIMGKAPAAKVIEAMGESEGEAA